MLYTNIEGLSCCGQTGFNSMPGFMFSGFLFGFVFIWIGAGLWLPCSSIKAIFIDWFAFGLLIGVIVPGYNLALWVMAANVAVRAGNVANLGFIRFAMVLRLKWFIVAVLALF